MHRLRIFSLLVCLLALSISAHAQTGNAAISGRVVDHSGAVIQKADVSIKNLDTGTTIESKTNNDGIYTFPSVKPGNYVMRVQKQGFRSVDVTGLTLYTQDQLARNFSLEVGSASESITVTGGTTNDSPAVSMTVSREFVENMPLNGRSFQDLIQLAPGTVSGGGLAAGYYLINGQRSDANNFTVDGVSANLGGIKNQAYGSDAGVSGSAPLQTVLGTTQSLASIDSLQEFTIQTSGYTAEYGRNPGGQVQFTTRSGTNDIHGTLFDYLRNTAFDANSFENNYFGFSKTAEHQNDFGGTIGGPLIIPKIYNGKNATFYFFSYEGLRLLLPASESEYVPTTAFRNSVSSMVLPYIGAFPLPNPNSPGNNDGCTVLDPATGQSTACDALFNYAYSYPNNLDNISVRVDRNLGKRFHAFVRYADTPSSEVSGAENVITSAINTHTWTAGGTAIISSASVNDLRFNYSHDGEKQVSTQRAIGGSVPTPRNDLIPSQYDSAYAYGGYRLSVPGSALSMTTSYAGTGTVQHQYQILDTIVWHRGAHDLKLGEDWRRLTPTYAASTYFSNIQATTLSDIQQGYATTIQINATTPGQPIFDNLSLFVQDHWKLKPTLSLDYGVRWEFNPAPGPSNGHYPVALTSSNLATALLAPLGTQAYKTYYDKLAPRFGFAWNAISAKEHALTVRGGFGIFYDTGQSVIGLAYTGSYPFTVSRPTQTHVPLPLSSSASAPPAPNQTLTPPYPYLVASDVDLTLPYTEQWNLSVDEALSPQNTLTASYVGNNGRKLLYSGTYNTVPSNPNFAGGLQLTTNASQSSYNALQLQDTGRIARGLDLVASFTLAHALDNASNGDSGNVPLWANSDYDVRRVLNLALNYQIPNSEAGFWTKALTRGWLLANRFSTQSGSPVAIVQRYVILPNGTQESYFPDLVAGVPIYLHGSAADVNGGPTPGSWRLNRAAFALVPTNSSGTPVRQGTLGRNYVRNPSFWALNTTLQRSFPLHDQLHLDFRVDAFNIFNHPNFGSPDTYLPDSTFGQLNGYGLRTIGSSNALYSMGAARSLQMSLKLQF